METACANCGVQMKYYEHGNLFLYNKDKGSSPVNESQQLEEHTFLIQYESLDSLYNLLLPSLSRLSEEGWECSLSPLNRPLEFITITDLMNRIKHKDMVEIIQKGEFDSHLQPIIDLKNYTLFGYESLLRASDYSKKFNPGVLFEAASMTGFHSMLDQKARKAAIESRIGQVNPGLKSFINFLPSTIYNPEFCLQHTFSIINEFGMNPKDLVFEVVETEKIEDVEHLKAVLDVYKREGMKVALDDVGSGFATLEMLTLLKPDYVKIDRSYIDHCDSNIANQQFLNKVLKIAQDIGIYVLAEGIEREEELQYCKEIGFHYAQGYYIGKPSKYAEEPLISPILAESKSSPYSK